MVFVQNNITQREEHHSHQQNQARILTAKRDQLRRRQNLLGLFMRSLSGGKRPNLFFLVHRILFYLVVGWILGCEESYMPFDPVAASLFPPCPSFAVGII
ncbi:hypothetical protein [Paenibacillus sp. 32O-W]|uniref:hypothetical protein n=1 Tax=Paenibacillus sp. 32O-W TaxID=1695218 RepID=UPI0003745FF3|nr:hypothetical protein [Paenibacillus sp. 32O-W]